MKIAKTVIGLCTGALLLSGCMTEEPVKQRATDERIELIGKSSFSIELLSARTLINDEGLLTVDASVLLSRTGPLRWIFCGDPNVTVWYHFAWIDAQGNINPPVQREMVALPGSIIDLHGVAPEEKYINYRLTVSLKGPGNDAEADKQNKKAKPSGEVKPAGKSEAAIVKTNAKPAAKPAEKKAEAKPAAKSAAKPAEKKAETPKAAEPQAKKADPKKTETKSAAGKNSKQQKLTEPFD